MNRFEATDAITAATLDRLGVLVRDLYLDVHNSDADVGLKKFKTRVTSLIEAERLAMNEIAGRFASEIVRDLPKVHRCVGCGVHPAHAHKDGCPEAARIVEETQKSDE